MHKLSIWMYVISWVGGPTMGSEVQFCSLANQFNAIKLHDNQKATPLLYLIWTNSEAHCHNVGMKCIIQLLVYFYIGKECVCHADIIPINNILCSLSQNCQAITCESFGTPLTTHDLCLLWLEITITGPGPLLTRPFGGIPSKIRVFDHV